MRRSSKLVCKYSVSSAIQNLRKECAMKRFVFVFGVLTLVFAACAKKGPDEVKIGALLALTGSGANYGKSLKQGIEIAKDEINANGGIRGKKLNVIYEDSQGDAKVGVSAFNKLVDIDKVPLVFGSISSVVLAVAPIADQKHVVLVNSSAISPKIPERATDFLFSLMTSGADESRLMARELVKKYAREPIAILFSNNASGVDTKNSFVAELDSLGARVAIAEGYELGSTKFQAQLSKIKASKAKIGYLIAFSSQEWANIFIQTKELNIPIQWFSYSGMETKETLELAKGAAEGVIYSYPQYDTKDTLMEKFQEKYQRRYEAWADIYTVTSYDGVKIVAGIMAKYGTSSVEIQKGLREAGSFKGLFGPLEFKRNQSVSHPLFWKTVFSGSFISLQVKR